MQNYLLIFDFDGTIADTFHHILMISNHLSGEFKFKKIEPHEVEILKDKTSIEVIQHLQVPVYKIPAIIAKAKNQLNKDITVVKPIHGIREMLLKLKSIGYKIGILSSNSTENVLKFLKHHDLNFFDFIHTTSNIWSKNTILNKLIKNNGFKINQVIYIGDETRDIIAARKAGVKVAAVTWGYNSRKALQTHNPDFLFNHPEDLVQLYIKDNKLD